MASYTESVMPVTRRARARSLVCLCLCESVESRWKSWILRCGLSVMWLWRLKRKFFDLQSVGENCSSFLNRRNSWSTIVWQIVNLAKERIRFTLVLFGCVGMCGTLKRTYRILAENLPSTWCVLVGCIAMTGLCIGPMWAHYQWVAISVVFQMNDASWIP